VRASWMLCAPSADSRSWQKDPLNEQAVVRCVPPTDAGTGGSAGHSGRHPLSVWRGRQGCRHKILPLSEADMEINYNSQLIIDN